MSNEPIRDAVLTVLQTKLGIHTERLASTYWDTPLTGRHFRMASIDMVYLLFELEKLHNVRVKEEHLTAYNFNTINAITKAIQNSQ